MPSGKSKEDTWSEKDLMSAIQGKEEDRKHRSRRDKSSRVKENGEISGEKRRESRHRSKEEKQNRDGVTVEKHHRSKTEEGKRHDGESRTRRHREDNGEKPHRSKSIGNSETTREKDRHRNEPVDNENERKHRRQRIENESKKTESKNNKHRDREHKEEQPAPDKSRDRNESEEDKAERRRRRKERELAKVKNVEGDTKSKNEGKESKERRKESEKKREREHTDKDASKHRRKDKDSAKDNDDDERRKRQKEREKEMMNKLAEQERVSSDVKSAEKVVSEEEAGGYDYEDDFDEYDDEDFEEDDGDADTKGTEEDGNAGSDCDNAGSDAYLSDENQKVQAQTAVLHLSQSEQKGIDEVLTAISEENKFALLQVNHKSRPAVDSQFSEKKEEGNKKLAEKKSFGKINFIAASQKQLTENTSRKTKKRGQELLKLIQLDVRSFELFDLPPMTEYELYMKRFGASDSIQISTQTRDEDLTQETQTDEIETESKWCQFSHDIKSCGSGDTNKSNSDEMNNVINDLVSSNSVRLNKFLLKASQVCLSLLEEIEAGIEQPRRKYTESKSTFSDGYVTLESSNFLVLGRKFCQMAYSISQTNMLLTAYGASNVVKKDHKSPKGLICVWNTNEPVKPYKLLTCESVPKSCCFCTGKASVAFAGMEDGVIAVWDLREPDSYHKEVQVGNDKHVFRTASFTTSALNDSHRFPIVSITPVMSNSSYIDSKDYKDDIVLSFQLASLDQSGLINIWILIDVIQDATDLTHLSDDLGLSPKSKIKLAISATIPPYSFSPTSFDHLFSSCCFQVDPVKPNHLYTGTEEGHILHYVRFGNRPIPKSFRLLHTENAKVNAFDISPWRMPFILACYDDGCVHLFEKTREHPIASWSMFSNGAAILDVRWSRSKPNIFFAIDDQSVLYAWDLLTSDEFPVFEQKLTRKDKRAIGFSFANDYSSLGVGTPGRPSEMAIVYGDGSVEIHRLSKHIAHMKGSELDDTQKYLDNIT